jgi:hypothetical protein
MKARADEADAKLTEKLSSLNDEERAEYAGLVKSLTPKTKK